MVWAMSGDPERLAPEADYSNVIPIADYQTLTTHRLGQVADYTIELADESSHEYLERLHALFMDTQRNRKGRSQLMAGLEDAVARDQIPVVLVDIFEMAYPFGGRTPRSS